MKSFLEVENVRRDYHQNSSRNTVHRTSLLTPKLAGATTCISFLNHFLIKRGYAEVVCKLTALDSAGQATRSISIGISEPRVYTLDLDDCFQDAENTSLYLIEFYSHKNLFIPFPAVMVNHVGDDFTNVVHAYNRVLNDIFENDAINKQQASEASIDVCVDPPYDTFFNFVAGPFKPAAELSVSLVHGNNSETRTLQLSVERLAGKNFFLSEIFATDRIAPGAVLKIRQPRQELFYGRLLAGIINRNSQAFSANHSYYDSSQTPEYFDNVCSRRNFPYFAGFRNHLTMYPVMSPGTLSVHLRLHHNGSFVDAPAQMLTSPSGTAIAFDVDALARHLCNGNCSSFEVIATAVDGGNIPTRVMHQLGYGMKNSKSRLDSSIAVGLHNEQVFVPAHKTGFTWGQMLCHPDYESRMALCFGNSTGDTEQVEIGFYDETGCVAQSSARLASCESLLFNPQELLADKCTGPFVWFVAKSTRADLSAQSFHCHKISHHSSGEHSF